MQLPAPEKPLFHVICVNCDGISVAFDYREDAPSQTIIKCRLCGAPRGSLGDLRKAAVSASID